jgi:hypothetical protein
MTMLLAAAAGGLGWGIRGQYGHETGAMIAGVLVGFTLVLLRAPHLSSLRAARAVALMAIGVSLGGSMTYGQTIGLTQNASLIGNGAALRWGLLGLFIKGGIWIGFAGALLGMGLSGKRYRAREIALLWVALLLLQLLGMWLLNSPFDPARRVLPRIYFSADWRWEPTAQLRPRRECWGGLGLALVGLVAYLYAVRRDRLAGNLALVGFLAGGLGFSGGQCVQAWHAWNPQLVAASWLRPLEPHINWWNMMEISFGVIWGGLLGAGLWLNRRRLPSADEPDEVEWGPVGELVLVAVYILLLAGAEFANVPAAAAFLELSLVAMFIPAIAVVAGRYWPYLFALPIVVLPIAGKSLRELVYTSGDFAPAWGWIVLLIVPLTVSGGLAIWLAHRGKVGQSGRTVARVELLTTAWIFFGLNLCFFRFPWPWSSWTGRTPSLLIFAACTLMLTAAALRARRPSLDVGARTA